MMKQQQGVINVVNVVEKSEREKHYPQLHNVDRILRHFRESGIGLERKRAALITPDIEAKL